jgi:hypothetical protein
MVPNPTEALPSTSQIIPSCSIEDLVGAPPLKSRRADGFCSRIIRSIRTLPTAVWEKVSASECRG